MGAPLAERTGHFSTLMFLDMYCLVSRYLGLFSLSFVTDFLFNSFVLREPTWYDFNSFELLRYLFMALDVICLAECSCEFGKNMYCVVGWSVP